MLIRVQVKTKQKVDEVILLLQEDTLQNIPTYLVKTKSQPIEGQANLAIVKLLSKYFNVSQSEVRLFRGEKSKIKVFEVDKNNFVKES